MNLYQFLTTETEKCHVAQDVVICAEERHLVHESSLLQLLEGDLHGVMLRGGANDSCLS